MLEEGLDMAVKDLLPISFELPNSKRVSFGIQGFSFTSPAAPVGAIGIKNQTILPTECRQRGSTYKGKFDVKINWSVNGNEMPPIDKEMGEVPIMLRVSIFTMTAFFNFQID